MLNSLSLLKLETEIVCRSVSLLKEQCVKCELCLGLVVKVAEGALPA